MPCSDFGDSLRVAKILMVKADETGNPHDYFVIGGGYFTKSKYYLINAIAFPH